MNEEEITQLENQVQGLMAWKNKRAKERFVLPMDVASKKTLAYWATQSFNGLPIFTGKVVPAYTTDLTELLIFGLEVKINNAKRVIKFKLELKNYTVNATTNVFTYANGNHNLNNGDRIAFTTDGLLPNGLNEVTAYYVINRTGTTFQVSTSSGGSAVDVTDAGSGNQYYAFL